ncbi:hypothetical protein [Roseovarius aquimarinus]|uniref:Uncharacterized protein n=1 Tax=Roseovarius aquimarinus TaxID=1229156 RepID=A0ABW7I5V9_9RHOB
MGFPYENVDWAAVDGAMFIGWTSALPGICTVLAMIVCVAVLIFGQSTEASKMRNFDT